MGLRGIDDARHANGFSTLLAKISSWNSLTENCSQCLILYSGRMPERYWNWVSETSFLSILIVSLLYLGFSIPVFDYPLSLYLWVFLFAGIKVVLIILIECWGVIIFLSLRFPSFHYLIWGLQFIFGHIYNHFVFEYFYMLKH